MGIVVIGTVFVDIKGYPLDRFVPTGRNAGRIVTFHGGVSRNVAEDIANVGLAPTFLSVVDDSGISTDVIDRLNEHGVNTDYILRTKDGLGTWLAIFDNRGDVAASISRRPEVDAIGEILDQCGDEVFAGADSVVVEIDMPLEVIKKAFYLAKKYGKDIYAVVANMSIALERREFLKETKCIVCNDQEAGILFSENYEGKKPEEMEEILRQRLRQAKISSMVVTMGAAGAVYAEESGESGFCPPQDTDVVDTTGAGDAFFAGVAIGLTYGKSLPEACRIGTRLAVSVIATRDSVCPSFRPEEFDLVIGG